MVNAGLVKVGGMKSRGFGKVRIELNEVVVFSLNHERYGIKDGELQPLDPIDAVSYTHLTLPTKRIV